MKEYCHELLEGNTTFLESKYLVRMTARVSNATAGNGLPWAGAWEYWKPDDLLRIIATLPDDWGENTDRYYYFPVAALIYNTPRVLWRKHPATLNKRDGGDYDFSCMWESVNPSESSFRTRGKIYNQPYPARQRIDWFEPGEYLPDMRVADAAASGIVSPDTLYDPGIIAPAEGPPIEELPATGQPTRDSWTGWDWENDRPQRYFFHI